MNSSSIAEKAAEPKRLQMDRLNTVAHSSSSLFGWALCTIAVAAVCAVLWATGSRGSGVTADSVTYLNAARTLLRGEGLLDFDEQGHTVGLTHYPPLFPTVLAALAAVSKVDVEVAARWLNAFLFGATIVLVGMGCRRRLPDSRWALLAALLVSISVPLVVDHLYALSEPLFLFLSIAALMELMQYLDTGSRTTLVISGCLMAASLLARYAGVAVVGTGVLAILLLSEDSWIVRLRRAIALGAMAVLPLGVWVMVRPGSGSGTKSSLLPVLHAPSLNIFASGAETLAYWIVPSSVPLAISLCLLVAAIAITSFLLVRNLAPILPKAVRQTATGAVPSLLGVLALFVGCYLLVLIIGRTFAFEDIIPDDRTLSIMLMPSFVIGIWTIASAGGRERKFAAALLGIVALFAGSNLLRSGRFLLNTRSRGLGYVNSVWTNSPVVDSVRKLPAGVKLYSNLPSAVRFLSRRQVSPVPGMRSLHTGERNPDYLKQVDDLVQRVRSGDAAVACFTVSPPNPACVALSEPQLKLRIQSDDNRGFLLASLPE